MASMAVPEKEYTDFDLPAYKCSSDGMDTSCEIQVIDEKGTFNVAGVDNFVKEVELANCGQSLSVVSIMGPSCGGKSTLLNELFHTKFLTLDGSKHWERTTKGIWMARCVGIEPCTLVMDLEGYDGTEDDTAFVKQRAQFALEFSDIVLVNMWCHHVGTKHVANKPLLKTVFQVMMQSSSPRKTTLMFVLRDKSTRIPLENLEPVLLKDLNEIWNSIQIPPGPRKTGLRDFLNVEVTALPCYAYQDELFIERVADLRKRLMDSIARRPAEDRRAVFPLSEISLKAQQIWMAVKEYKDLDLPAHKCSPSNDGRASCSIQVTDGTFNMAEKFLKDVKLAECLEFCAVVSIMGPHGIGKCTLLNELFHTKFPMMDGSKIRERMTKGIWMATLVMDLEGNDGREDALDKQSVRFALEVSDIVLVNMWGNDICFNLAAHEPLLKTLFEVMMRLSCPRKKTLMFVIPEESRILELVDPLKDLNQIWDSVQIPPGLEKTSLRDFLNVEVTTLPNYKYEEKLFKEQVAVLREQLFDFIAPCGLAGDRRTVFPPSEFPLRAKQIWKAVKEYKDFDLPAYKCSPGFQSDDTSAGSKKFLKDSILVPFGRIHD